MDLVLSDDVHTHELHKPNPKGPSSPHLWLLVPKMDPKSYNREYLDPQRNLSIPKPHAKETAFCPECKIYKEHKAK